MDSEPNESSYKSPHQDLKPELAFSKSSETSAGSTQIKEHRPGDEELITDTKSDVASRTTFVALSSEKMGANSEGSPLDIFDEAKPELDAIKDSETTRELDAKKKTGQVNKDTKSDVASKTTPVALSSEKMGANSEGSPLDIFDEAKPELDAIKDSDTKSDIASLSLSSENGGPEIEGSSSDTFAEAKPELDKRIESGNRSKDTKSDVPSRATPVSLSNEKIGAESEGSSFDILAETKPELDERKESVTTRELGARKKIGQRSKVYEETISWSSAKKKTGRKSKGTRSRVDTSTTPASSSNERTGQGRNVLPLNTFVAKRAELDARWKSGIQSKGEISRNAMIREVSYMSASGSKHYTMDTNARGLIKSAPDITHTVSSVKEIQLTRKMHEKKLWIRGSCVLPDCSILLVDSNNNKLIKLDCDYNLINDLDLERSSVDVCYIGNQTAAVSNETAIQFVDISGKMKLENRVELGNKCYGIACHNDCMYAIDDNTLYRCTKNGTKVEEMLQRPTTGRGFSSVAVSYDEQMLYIALGDEGLLSLDIKRGAIYTGKPYSGCDLISVCPVGDGTVFVCDFEKDTLLQVDYKGEVLLGQISLKCVCDPITLCFDTQRCRVIVGYCYKDFISVLELRSGKSPKTLDHKI